MVDYYFLVCCLHVCLVVQERAHVTVPSGSEEECEIRASTIVAVEKIKLAIQQRISPTKQSNMALTGQLVPHSFQVFVDVAGERILVFF